MPAGSSPQRPRSSSTRLIVVGPLALLALAAWLAARAGRRRQSERLLARS